jgi:hypothetical protein
MRRIEDAQPSIFTGDQAVGFRAREGVECEERRRELAVVRFDSGP